jgi:regulatory protein
MKITAIEPQKKAKGRVNIYVDDKFSFGMTEKLLIDFDLYKGKEITEKEIEKFKSGDSLSKCMDKAYHFLSYRPRSEQEMRKKLREKYDEGTVDKAIAKLKKYSFVDDSEFARMWVGTRFSGRSKKALSFEMKQKGISKEIIEEALADIDFDKEYEAALELVKKRAKYKGLDRNEAYKKIAPFLSRRGYNYDVIKKVINEQKN